jgi:hypothetical protein
MAETFGDTDAMAKILEASTTMKSEEAMKSIKGFDENVWLTVCVTWYFDCFIEYANLVGVLCKYNFAYFLNILQSNMIDFSTNCSFGNKGSV